MSLAPSNARRGARGAVRALAAAVIVMASVTLGDTVAPPPAAASTVEIGRSGSGSAAAVPVGDGDDVNAVAAAALVAVLLTGDDRTDAVVAADRAIEERLQAAGFEVLVSDQSFHVRLAELPGLADVVVVSSSVDPDVIGASLAATPFPIVVSDPGLYRHMSMTVAGPEASGITSPLARVRIIAARHPLAAGLSGRPRVVERRARLSFGLPAGGTIIAREADGLKRPVLFAFEAGERMGRSVAPARRVGFLFSDETAPVATGEGWALFDAAVRWAAEGSRRVRAVAQGARISPLATSFTASIRCAAGEVATGGGFLRDTSLVVDTSRPIANDGVPVGWFVRGSNPASSRGFVEVHATCARGIPARVHTASTATAPLTATARCPQAAGVTGGGWASVGGVTVRTNEPTAPGSWTVSGASSSDARLTSVAICVPVERLATRVATNSFTLARGEGDGVNIAAECEPGETNTGGGYALEGNLVLEYTGPGIWVWDSPIGWFAQTVDPGQLGGEVRVHAVCAVPR